MEARFEFVQLPLLLVEVLDEATSAFLHLIEAALETYPVWCLVALAVLDFVIGDWVLGVPDVVGDELFNLIFPLHFQIVVVHRLDLRHEALNVLDEDVVASDQHSLLGPTRADAVATGHRGCGLHRGLRV